MSGTPILAILQIQTSGGGRDEHPLRKPKVSIGRASDNDVILDDKQVSGHHLRLAINANGSITAMDLGSLNGTRLNGRPMSPRQPTALRPGDTLQVDPFSFSVRLPSPQAPNPAPVADRVRISASPQPALAIFANDRLTKYPLTKAVVNIGQASENDVVIPSPQVADHHARLQQQGQAWIVQDLGRGQGVIYNGQRVQQQMLADGDVFYLDQGVAIQMRAFLGFVPASAEAEFPSSVHTIRLDQQETITVGRAPDNDIVINHPGVSRYHLLIERLGTRRRIKDLKSFNGVFVNNQRVEGEAWLQEGDEIRVGAIGLRLVGGDVQRLAEEGVRLDAVRLRKWVSKSKNLLQDVSLSIHPEEFVAIVGLSGAGKSTLVNALNGFSPATHGLVLANGVNLYRHFDLFRSDVGYVPQQNTVHTDLTVYKALDYAAQLRMPADTTKKERHRRIMEVLTELDLAERKDLVIHKLSGGQLKRVSIGVELLTKPRLFFLDEPTSGLDPGTEYNMMRLLRKLADQGRTIVLVTHATKNVMMCDKVLFMVRGGQVAFYGPPEEALTYFDGYRTDYERRVKGVEFDDIYTILEDDKRGKAEDWVQRYHQSPAYRTYISGRFRELKQERAKPGAARLPAQRRPRVSSLRQFSILTRRYLDLVLRDRLLLTVLLAVMPIIALLILMISQADSLVGSPESEILRQLTADLAEGAEIAAYAVAARAQRLLNTMALAAVLLGLFAAAYELVKERAIYQRERMVSLRLLPYLASKVVVLLAFALAQCLLFLLVISLKVDFPKDGVLLPAPLELYITLVLSALAAVMLGLFISAFVPNQNTVIYVILLVLFFQIIFAGVQFELPDRAGKLSSLTLTRWANEAMGATVDVEGLNELSRPRFQPEPITEDVALEVQQPGPDGVAVTRVVTQTVTLDPGVVDIASAQTFNITYSATTRHLVSRWLALIGLGFVFGLGTVVVLKRKDVS